MDTDHEDCSTSSERLWKTDFLTAGKKIVHDVPVREYQRNSNVPNKLRVRNQGSVDHFHKTLAFWVYGFPQSG